MAFPAMLQKYQTEVARALPKHISVERMTRIALTAYRRTPKLGECDPRSVFAAVIQASQLGLEPDTLGRSFLVPYKRECQFVPGWKGLVDLVNRAGNATVWTGAVFAGDEFEWQLGDQPFLRHRPLGGDEPDNITHFYAIGKVKGADQAVIECWTSDRVRKHRDRYNKVGNKHYSHLQWEMYGRKVVLLQVLKYLPASPELALAISLNDGAELGSQKLDLKDAIEGTYVCVPENDEPVEQTSHEQAAYSDDALAKNLPNWRKLIEAGTKTADDIIAVLQSKFTLTPKQVSQIKGLEPRKASATTEQQAAEEDAPPPADETAEWVDEYGTATEEIAE